MFLPTPRRNNNIENVAKPLILVEKKVINEKLLNNDLENLDLNKYYHIFFDKTNKKFELKQ
jgi:hypothetical protein